jgi:hypothetical protein
VNREAFMDALKDFVNRLTELGWEDIQVRTSEVVDNRAIYRAREALKEVITVERDPMTFTLTAKHNNP